MGVSGKLNVSGAMFLCRDIVYDTAVNGALRVTPKMLLLKLQLLP